MGDDEDSPWGPGDVDPRLVLVHVHPRQRVEVVVGQVQPRDDKDGGEAQPRRPQGIQLPCLRVDCCCADLIQIRRKEGQRGYCAGFVVR